MKAIRFGGALTCAFALTACQGNYSSGPQVPSTIPPAAVGVASPPPSGAPAKTGAQVAPAGAQTFAIADAARGFACAPSAGFSCLLRFNLPPETPAPKAGTTPAPTATPHPSASPSASAGPSMSPAPSASPAGGTMVLSSTVLPTDAPKMVNTAKNAAPTTALLRIELIASTDFTLEGRGIADFTLPKEQLSERGFAVQIF